jgi:hypothetical protein
MNILHIMEFAKLLEIILNWLYCLFFSSQHAVNNNAINKSSGDKYEYKYIKRFDQLKNNEVPLKSTEKSLRYSYSYTMDHTPCGNIVMKYDREQELFTYYSDKKDIPYKYLETVARKFVINNDCLELYIDIRDELRKKVYDVVIVDDTSDYGAKDERIKSVFATFKKQNGNQNIVNDVYEAKSGAMTRSKAKAKAKAKANSNIKSNDNDKSKNVVFKENINRYKWIGRFCDFSILEKTHMVHGNDNTVPEEISFSEFKKKS